MFCKHNYVYTQGHFYCTKCHHRTYKEEYGKQKSKKAPPIIGIVIVVLILGGGLYYLQTSETNISELVSDLDSTVEKIQESIPKEVMDLEIVPEIPNFFDDGIYTYKIDNIPSKIKQTSMIKEGVYDGFSMWSAENPELVFQEITVGKPDIQISWIEYEGTHSGLGCLDCLYYGATIEAVLGTLDCNGKFTQYDQGMIANIIAHEFGHNLGLEHNKDENHLMWSDTNIQIPYETLDYNIPNRVPEYFFGYEKILGQYELLQKEIEEMGKEFDLLNARYGQFPKQARTEGEYQRAMQAYNELTVITNNYNNKVEQSNQLVEKMNCFYPDNVTYREGITLIALERTN